MSSDSKILTESGTNEAEFLRFSVGTQLYGINVAKVRQVLLFDRTQLVELPGTPAAVLGSFRFRDRPIPIIDLKSYLRKDAEPSSPRPLLLVTEFNQCVVGFVVDAVDSIMRCNWQQFVPLEHGSYGSHEPTVIGTIMTKTEMIPVLDVEILLSMLVPHANIETRADQVTPTADISRASVKVLYCEDSTIVQKTLMRYLAAAGVNHVTLCTTGREGLDVLSLNQEQFDIIISDIEMPVMDGLTFCRELRKLPHCATTPVIFFSSTVTPEMKLKCLDVGGTSAVSKPEIEQIVHAIDDYVVNKSK